MVSCACTFYTDLHQLVFFGETERQKFKKTMKKFRLLATLLVVALCTTTIFTSCRNGDDDENGNGGNAATITATNVAGTITGIATVKAVVPGWDSDWGSDDIEGGGSSEPSETIAQAPFQNRGFTLQLPTPPSRLLHLLYGGDGIPTGITVSDNAVRIAAVGFVAYNSAGYDIGEFYFADWSWDGDERPNVSNDAFWIYADRNVTMTGARGDDEWIVNYNLNLRRGWNIAYVRHTRTTAGNVEIHTVTYTSQRPSGANLSWRVDNWGAEERSAHSATTRATENRKSLFIR